MAETLRKLVSNDFLRTMYENLELWQRDYNTNSCDQNLSFCLEFIEQVAKIQGQLFGILTTTAQEGGRYDGVEVIKSRLLPWLETAFTAASLGKPIDSKVPSLQDTFERERQKEAGARDREMKQLEVELSSTHNQINQIQDDLPDSPKTLEATKNSSAISLLAAEEEINQLKKQGSRSRSPSGSRSRSGSPSNAMVKIRTPSPNRAKLSSAARKAALLSRFSDAYSQARLDAQCMLRQCIDNAETVQRIIYIATVEAFHVAKMAFRHFKIRVRKSLTPSYMGANDFEDAVTDYIICHLDLYDSQNSVNDVIRAMNVNPKISFPPEVDFCLLSNFIQEICCIAFAMQTLEPPLDIAFGADGEMFNDCKYRRSYDSDFTAPLVFYHVWPALMENDIVAMKGEAVTKRGAFWNSVRPLSRSRSRSLSPICPRSRIGMSLISRSRSPSPIRCALPRY
uniref:Mitochondria-eating protein n=1 Tax=Myotis myotis TaxID=51298 RepID=A0A7J8AR41_MYOMY|nr:spermatogenesis associated 18 [Myotis myotis]